MRRVQAPNSRNSYGFKTINGRLEMDDGMGDKTVMNYAETEQSDVAKRQGIPRKEPFWSRRSPRSVTCLSAPTFWTEGKSMSNLEYNYVCITTRPLQSVQLSLSDTERQVPSIIEDFGGPSSANHGKHRVHGWQCSIPDLRVHAYFQCLVCWLS